MNDLVVAEGYVLPIIDRKSVRVIARDLIAPLSGWQTDMATLPHWYRKA